MVEEDKDLMEMRRRALESMARGRLQQLQQNSEKKIIVPLNEESSSGLFVCCKGSEAQFLLPMYLL